MMLRQTDKIIAFSDYSAGPSGGQYDACTYGFVIPDSVIAWNAHRSEWRRQWLSGGRLMEWKHLRDGMLWRALPRFLEVASILDGWCITILVDRKIGALTVHRDDFNEGVRSRSFAAPWSFKEFEQAFRKCLFLTLITMDLVPTTTRLAWLTDRDQFMTGSERQTDVLKILTLLSLRLRGEQSGRSELGDTALDKDDRAVEDLIALADLSAGSILEAVRASGVESSQVSQVREITDALRPRCHALLSWRARTEGRLRHRCVAFVSGKTGTWSIHAVTPIC